MQDLQRGCLLPTNTTEAWTDADKEEANDFEKTRVFTDFDFKDKGIGRKLVATFNNLHPDYEEAINLFTSAPRLLELIEAFLKCPASEPIIMENIVRQMKGAVKDAKEGKNPIVLFIPKTK